jgi:peptide-methionine (S)-S-oxide reductase
MIALISLLLAGEFMIAPSAKGGAEIQAMNSPVVSVNRIEAATFAGGCFWGVEYAFEHVPGVVKTEVGFMGGKVNNPSYTHVCTGNTNHAEVVHLEFDPAKVSYRKLVEYFFRIHDPTTANRQGPDVGTQYRSAIFFHSEEQKQIAEDVIAELTNKKTFKRPIVTQLVPAQSFWKAEDYHQKYFDSHPERAVCHRIPKFE